MTRNCLLRQVVAVSHWAEIDDGRQCFWGLTNLQSLYLDGTNKVTDAGVADLRKALPNCEIFK